MPEHSIFRKLACPSATMYLRGVWRRKPCTVAVQVTFRIEPITSEENLQIFISDFMFFLVLQIPSLFEQNRWWRSAFGFNKEVPPPIKTKSSQREELDAAQLGAEDAWGAPACRLSVAIIRIRFKILAYNDNCSQMIMMPS